MKKAIVIGASSGIGEQLAIVLAKEGYIVGLMARRTHLLDALKESIPTQTHVGYLDLSKPLEASENLKKMISKLKGIDLIVINAGTGFLNPELDFLKEQQTLDTNVYGFCAMAVEAYKFFAEQGHGHIVGISSIGALRGNPLAPSYNASKAFMSNYLEGLRKKAFQDKLPITVTTILPGFVDTAMAKGEGKFWVASPQKAAEQIALTIRKQKQHAYITRRWRLIGWLLKLMPNWLYTRVG